MPAGVSPLQPFKQEAYFWVEPRVLTFEISSF